jgi:hypothetical protein
MVFRLIFDSCKNYGNPYLDLAVTSKKILNLPCVLGLLALSPSLVHGWQPGVIPAAPQRMQSTGFAVNNFDRNDVVAFWHAVYKASEGYEKRVDWTGNYTGNPGKTSAVFAQDIERRLNFFRALCGVPPFAKVNQKSRLVVKSSDPHKPQPTMTKEEAAQEAALMLVRNFDPVTGNDPAITHDPSPALIGWTKAAWNANANGNLAFGVYGPGAITEYMVEELSAGTATSTWNTLVGHRRWALFPQATSFGSGDQPGASAYKPPTNVLYVFQKDSELKATKISTFTTYPAAGFFPAPVNSRYWSISREGADFSSASVRVTDSKGKVLPVTGVMANSSYAEPALLWQVPPPAASRSVEKDASFKISVTGIKGDGIPSSYNYSVTLINPDCITSDQRISGSAVASSKKDTFYQFTPPSGADAVAVAVYQRSKAPWTENAEPLAGSRIIDNTSSSYSLTADLGLLGAFGGVTGTRAYRLTFPTIYDLIQRKVPDQSFEINRDILPGAGAKLRFVYRRGYMTTSTSLFVETSSNGGVTWVPLGNPIHGVSNTVYDPNVSSAAYSLPASDAPLRVRFRLTTKPGQPLYTHEAAPTSPTGIFIDDITTTGCDWLLPKRVTTLQKKATQFRFNSRNAGAKLAKGSEWRLALRTRLGGKWFPDGPLKKIVVQ